MIASFRNSGERIISIISRNYSQKLLAVKLHRSLNRYSAKQKSKKQVQPLLLQKGTVLSAYNNEGSNKKVTALNKLYMEQISVLINSGDCGRQLHDLGIEITRVKVASGLNFLDVYWVAKTDNFTDTVLKAALNGAVKEIQENLSFVGFSTRVPFVRFVRDVRLEMGLKLEKLFEALNLEKDFELVHKKKVITEDFVPESRKFPVMKQNTLGLDHARIKARITEQINQFKAINTSENAEPPEMEMPNKLITFDRKEFFKFYKRRRILYLKLQKHQEVDPVIYEFPDDGDVEYELEDKDEDEEYEHEDEDLRRKIAEEEGEEYEYESEDEDLRRKIAEEGEEYEYESEDEDLRRNAGEDEDRDENEKFQR